MTSKPLFALVAEQPAAHRNPKHLHLRCAQAQVQVSTIRNPQSAINNVPSVVARLTHLTDSAPSAAHH
jgi:hypothetical protein